MTRSARRRHIARIARAERDEEYENTEHGGGVCLFRSLISSGSSPVTAARRAGKSLISNADGY